MNNVFLEDVKNFQLNFDIEQTNFNLPLPSGTMLNKGKFQIYSMLSKGSYGIVYLAADFNHHFYAIKEYLPQKYLCRTKLGQTRLEFRSTHKAKSFEQGLNSFFLEANTGLNQSSPYIVKILDIFEENNTAYIVMPFEKGFTLYYLAMIKRIHQLSLSVKEVVEIGKKLCIATNEFHKKGLLHLDIKPQNVWMKNNSDLILLDLGSTRQMNLLNEQPNFEYTIGYASPEVQVLKREKISESSDIYSIGATLYFLLFNQKPTQSNQRTDKNNLTQQFFGNYPSELLTLIDKTLSLDIESRTSSTLDLLSDLEKIQCDENLTLHYFPSQNLFKRNF